MVSTRKYTEEDTRYQKALEKFEKSKRRNLQNKNKGDKKAEAKIEDLQAEVSRLSQRLLMVTKLHRWTMKNVPMSLELKRKYEEIRTEINIEGLSGTLKEDGDE